MIAAVKKSSKILSICSSSEYGRGKYLTNRRDPTTHAEMGAILKLRNTNVDLTKCCIISLKVSFNDKNEFRLGNGCPCLMCSKTIIKLGIRKCIYSDEDHNWNRSSDLSYPNLRIWNGKTSGLGFRRGTTLQILFTKLLPRSVWLHFMLRHYTL